MTQLRRLETFICFQMMVIFLLAAALVILWRGTRSALHRYQSCRQVVSELDQALSERLD